MAPAIPSSLADSPVLRATSSGSDLRHGIWRDRPQLPTVLSVLAAAGVEPAPLLQAMRDAQRFGVSADAALLAAGFDGQRFGIIMARHLGVEFWSGEGYAPRIVPGRRMARAAAEGVVRLADRQGWLVVGAGEPLARLLRLKRGGLRAHARIVLTDRASFDRLLLSTASGEAADAAAFALARAHPALSAHGGASPTQWGLALAGLVGLVVLLALGGVGRTAIWLAVSSIYLASSLVRLVATAAAWEPVRARRRLLDDRDLPVASVLVPLYREARMLRPLIAALSRLDYPAAKLDIKIVVETDDHDTRDALAAIVLPPSFEVVVAPRGAPQTKPRALNIALPFCRGAIVSVFDAEDHPEPGQLREAASRLKAGGPRLACVQGRLTIHNGGSAWIAGLFGFEYAALFDVVTPGFAALGLPIALGGTSNHFRADVLRRVGGWDAWNVTEDIDLGLRMARAGYRVEALVSSTHEEAPTGSRAWTNQRRRWLKGWMQTLVVLTRRPSRLFADLGGMRASVVLVTVLGSLIGPLAGPIFGLDFLVEMLWGDALRPQGLGQVLASTLWLFVSVVGAASLALPAILGIKRRGLLRRLPLVMATPLYAGLLCLAGWLAWWDLLRRPFHWYKTEHGVSLAPADGEETAHPGQAALA